MTPVTLMIVSRWSWTWQQAGERALPEVVRLREVFERPPPWQLTTRMTIGTILVILTLTRVEHLMQTIQASKFKAKCLALMDQVARTGETILVTKNGKPVAELRPHRGPRAKSLIGLHKGRIKIRGDIVSPIGTELWDALK